MKKILVVYDGFDGINKVWDASTKSLEKKAYLALFKYAKDQGYFEEIIDAANYDGCDLCHEDGIIILKDRQYTCPQCNGYKPAEDWQRELNLFDRATRGVMVAIKQLVREYCEEYALIKVEKA